MATASATSKPPDIPPKAVKTGFRFLAWRLKFRWLLLTFIIFLVANYGILEYVKKHGVFITTKVQQELKRNQDSLSALRIQIDSLQIVKSKALDSVQLLRVQSIRPHDSIKAPIKKISKGG